MVNQIRGPSSGGPRPLGIALTRTPGTPIPVGIDPVSIVVTPDGKTACVADGNTVTPITVKTNTAGTPG